MRIDGFCSLDAGPVREGIIVTRPLVSEGKELVINAECRDGGSIEVEVNDAEYRSLSGFARDDCDTFRGNGVSESVSWKGKTEIPVARYRRFRFYMRNASLYSFSFI